MSKLNEWIIDCASGPFGSNLKVDCFVEDGFPIIDGANLKGVSVTDNITKFVTEEKARSLSIFIAKRHDVVVTISGTLGQIAFIPLNSKYEEYLCSQRQFRVTFDETKVDVEYLTYYFHTEAGQKKILSFANYVGVPALSQPLPNFKNIDVDFPDIDTQHRVVAVLREIDSKISNNNAICAELEAMAKLLYDYWFVQFDFPDENGKPYKSSGGKMVWNEELKREIPEGWTATQLRHSIVISQERISQGNIGSRVYVPIEVIPRKKMSFYETADLEKAATGLCSFDEKAILLSNRRVYFHKVSISPFKGVTRDTVIIINPAEDDNLGFVFETVNTDHFIEYATRNSYGTEQPVLSPSTVLDYMIAKSNCSVELRYSKVVNEYIEMVLGLQKENQELAALRDFLLPLLMNGQVTFKEADCH